MIQPIVIDFETDPIEDGVRSPKPVGVSIVDPRSSVSGHESYYYHWGHRDYHTGVSLRCNEPYITQTSAGHVRARLTDIWRSGRPLLFHHADFDLRVAHEHFGLPWPEHSRIHDTLWLAFLCDPNRDHLGLKELASQELGIDPSEQDELRAWIEKEIFDVTGKSNLRHGPKHGAYICYTPPKIAGKYANADTKMTWKLFQHLYPRMQEWGMTQAYERYQRAFAPMRRMEDRGVCVDADLAEDSYYGCKADMRKSEEYVRRRLGGYAGPLAGKSFAEVLQGSGKMDMDMWSRFRTPRTKELSTAYATLMRCIRPQHQGIVRALSAHARLRFAADTFNGFIEAPGSRLFPTWHTTRKHSGDNGQGARTGRLSSQGPNVQNFTKGPAESLPITKSINLTLPSVRQCIVPEKGHHFIDSDWRQQELRILAFYERGGLFSMYQADPGMDMHEYAGEQIEAISGFRLTKTVIKNTVFGILYGSGAALRAGQLGLDDRDPEVIKQMHATKRAYLNAMPDVQTFVRKLGNQSKHHVTPDRMLRGPSKSRFAAANIPLEPIYTIGGRLCFVENSTIDEEGDVVQSFAYKLLNTVIQGGAADMLEEAIIALDEHTDEPLTLTAHDQVLQSVPYRRAKTCARHVSHIMEKVVPEGLFCPSVVAGTERVRGITQAFDVPLITDTKIKKRWQE